MFVKPYRLEHGRNCFGQCVASQDRIRTNMVARACVTLVLCTLRNSEAHRFYDEHTFSFEISVYRCCRPTLGLAQISQNFHCCWRVHILLEHERYSVLGMLWERERECNSGHGYPGHRMLLRHVRDCALSMDALVTVCS